MGQKKGLSGFSREQLMEELCRREMEEHDGVMTMTEMELAVERMTRGTNDAPPIAAMLNRMKPEKPSAKSCPRCGKRTPVKARDRERTVRSLCGVVTFKRNYHYCEECKHGFYPVDYLLGLPEEGELSEEMERRVLDFALNDTFEEAAKRWSMHYPNHVISENLVRRVTDRIGRQCEEADERQLQLHLKPPSDKSPELLIVQTDGSQLPMRGSEPWKEAKVGVILRGEDHICRKKRARGRVRSARYVAVVGQQAEFSKALEQALEVEQAHRAKTVIWVGDGAPGNWSLAGLLCPQAIQILDWYHAVDHVMSCGKELLGEMDPMLSLWKSRAEHLLHRGDITRLVRELMDCALEASDEALGAIDDLIRYCRNNEQRMRYDDFVSKNFLIGSGIAESAHRHVLQIRMKRAGQHWSPPRAKRMARLRAAYRTAGAQEGPVRNFVDSVREGDLKGVAHGTQESDR
jgi:hypothetical protein